MSSNYQKRVYTLHTGTWTPVNAPIDCSDFWLKSMDGTAFLEDTAGTGECIDTILGNVLQFLPMPSSATRFQMGSTITFLSATVDGQKVVVTFVR